MGLPWKAIGSIALKIAGAIVPAVQIAENIAGNVATLKGKGKQDAAIEAIRGLIETTEAIAGRDLLNDAEVERAMRAAIDAVVALRNVLARKAAPAGV